jgi:hypothetical protein
MVVNIIHIIDFVDIEYLSTWILGIVNIVDIEYLIMDIGYC